ncbi:MAG: 4Fe-4S ferredoxin [Actinomycetota bacterium]
MREELAAAIREALEDGAAAAVFLTGEDGIASPRVARDSSDEGIERVATGDERYPMAGFVMMLSPLLEGGIAVVSRECDRRMLVELAKHNQVDTGRILFIGIPCSQELADTCGCDHPCPPDSVVACVASPAEEKIVEEAAAEDPAERFAFWMDSFSRCIKCMGCRNVCPMCYCKECALDNLELVGPESSPPDIPIFHLIRAVDMADHCVDCGMCEAICPAEIPLRSLYRQAREVVKEAFGYEPGVNPDEKSPIEKLGEVSDLAGMEEGFRST